MNFKLQFIFFDNVAFIFNSFKINCNISKKRIAEYLFIRGFLSKRNLKNFNASFMPLKFVCMFYNDKRSIKISRGKN